MVQQACLDIVGCDGDDVAVPGNQSSQVKTRLLLRSNTVNGRVHEVARRLTTSPQSIKSKRYHQLEGQWAGVRRTTFPHQKKSIDYL